MSKLLNRFLDWIGGVRRTDPDTSYTAAQRDRLPLHELVAGTIVGSGRGWTGKELAAELGVPLNSVTPRLAPLRRQGRIKDSGRRRGSQIVWIENTNA